MRSSARNTFLFFFVAFFLGNSETPSFGGAMKIQPTLEFQKSIDRPILMRELGKALSSMTANKKYVLENIFRLTSSKPDFIQEKIEFQKWAFPRKKKKFFLKKSLISFHTRIEIKNQIFDYAPHSADEVRYTVNFSDQKLFYFWRGALFAQDEMQVLEHPELGLLRDSLHVTDPGAIELNPKSFEVALIQNVRRLGAIDPSRIYGNRFYISTQKQLEKSIQVFDHPTLSNILAMAAPQAGKAGARYSRGDIDALFLTALTGFSAVRVRHPDHKLLIDTGCWGSGAFGNHPRIVAILQILAANAAQVDLLNYFVLTAQAQKEIELAQEWIDKKSNELGEKPVTVKTWLNHVALEAFRYGKSNGT